jgi:hypothetical protein
MMPHEQGTLETYNPWPKIGWGAAAAIVVVSAVLGFGILGRYQQDGPTLSLWNAICRGLGLRHRTGGRAAAAAAHAHSDRLDQRHARPDCRR